MGRSLGIEAQREAVTRFAQHGCVLATYTEVESGRRSDRPELAKALAMCRETGARLLIGKLDRLARDVHFISGLMKSDVRFVAADMPDADPFRLHIEAAIGEEEARKISQRTRAALLAAKARGVKLGGFRGRHFTFEEAAFGNARKTAKSLARARVLAPVLSELTVSGRTSLRALAAALNDRGVPAPRGGRWQATQVARVLARATTSTAAI